MPRPGTKRKPVETRLDYEEFGELESEIKIESAEVQFLEDAPFSDPGCCLCKTSSGDKQAVFGTGPRHAQDITNKIQSCLRFEISSEANPAARICRGCLQQLDGHYTFRNQAVKCNEYTQNQMAEAGAEFDILPEKISVCRFCLKIRKKLLDMYPDGESPEHDLLRKIRECLAIEVNSRDPVTKICRNCIKSTDDLLEFRTKHLPTSAYIKDEIWHYGPLKLVKKIKQYDEAVSKQDLARDLGVSESECSSEENEHPTSASRQMRPELVQLIGADVEGKNFTVLSEDGEQTKVIFEDQLFRFYLEREKGSSLWNCDSKKLRLCRMQLEIDATGKCATLLASVRSHSHPPGTVKLMQCPLGKGMTKINRKVEPFYIFCSKESIKRSNTNYTRSLIIQGFRYFLQLINLRGVKSKWNCVHRAPGGCKAKLTCYGIFHKVEIHGKHNHNKLAQRDIKTLLLQHRVDTTSTDAISEFQNINTVEMITEPWMTPATEMGERMRVELKSLVKETNPQIFGLLKQDDVERNFEVIKIGEKFKIIQNSYEYRYYGKLSNNCSVWKCVMDAMRRCKLLAKITPDGKHLEICKGKHSHGTEVDDIFGYPLGKRMIGEEPLWLLTRVSIYTESRHVVYMGNIFYIENINQKGEVRWSCQKYQCRAMLYTKGNFQKVVMKNKHTHEKPPESMITELLNEITTAKVEDNLSFKQKLLSVSSKKSKIWVEDENEYDTLYILTNVRKDTRSGFIFRRHRYTFESVDQNGTSQWFCAKYTVRKQGVRCGVAATMEGLFESIVVADQHTHKKMSNSKIKHLFKRYANLPNSSGEVENLEEISDHKRRTDYILSILKRHDPERNFTVARAKTKLLVNYEGEDFRLKSCDPEGLSTWCCIWFPSRKCQVSLQMAADGKQVSYLDALKQHNHADEQIGVYLQAPGKGQIYDKDKNMLSSYWLFSYQGEFRSNRGIIYRGNKYMLYSIQNDCASLWKCSKVCRVFVRVEGMFKEILSKHEHNHARLTDDEIKCITGQEEVDKDLLPDCENSNATVPSRDRPLHFDIIRIMSLKDPDRNFRVKIRGGKMKIIQEGYEYFYRSSTQSHTMWKCIYSSIRRCAVTLQIDYDCKQAVRPKLPEHRHSPKPSKLYGYPLGESKIMDTGTEMEKPFWFLMQSTFIRPKPFIIYEDHLYSMVFIAEKGNTSRWYCEQRDCQAKLSVKGFFESITENGSPHTHPPLAQDKKFKLIKRFGTCHKSNKKRVS